MKTTIKNLEILIISGCLNDTKMIDDLSQADINHLLYFAYKNNKFKAFHELLPYLKSLEFNNGKNIVTFLLGGVFIDEVTLIKSLEKIFIKDEVLKYYQDCLSRINEIVLSVNLRNSVSILGDVLDFQIRKNLFEKLEDSLSFSASKNKMVKI